MPEPLAVVTASRATPAPTLVGVDPSKRQLWSVLVRQTVPSPTGGVGYIGHQFNRGEVEDYIEVMVRLQNKGNTP